MRDIGAREHVVRICTGLACVATGGDARLRAVEAAHGLRRGQPSADGRLTLEATECLGLCTVAPVVEVDGVCHARVTSAQLERLPVWFRTRTSGCATSGATLQAFHFERARPGKRWAEVRQAAERGIGQRCALRLVVQTGSCGTALGAGDLVRALRIMVAMRGLDAEVIEGGCDGACHAGVVVEAYRPGMPRLTFFRVTKNIVPALLSWLAGNDRVPARGIEGVAWHDDGWRGLPPARDRSPWMTARPRLLDRAGRLNPVSLQETAMAGSYQTLVRFLDGDGIAIARARLRDVAARRRIADPLRSLAERLTSGDGDGLVVLDAVRAGMAAVKDRHLLEGDPHRVIEGLLLVACVTGASRVSACFAAHAHQAGLRFAAAAAEAGAAGLVGERILGCDRSVSLDIRREPAGAASDRSVADRLGVERSARVVVLDAETAAMVSVGLEQTPGGDDRDSAIITLAGVVRRPGLVETAARASAIEALEGPGGGSYEPATVVVCTRRGAIASGDVAAGDAEGVVAVPVSEGNDAPMVAGTGRETPA